MSKPAAETVSQKAARIRSEDRERKRKERAARKEARISDPREIDRALDDAIRDAPLPPAYAGSGAMTHPRDVVVQDIIRCAAHALHGRGYISTAILARLSRDTGTVY